MYFFSKLMSAYVLLHAIVALEIINLSGGMNMTWIQPVPNTKYKTPHKFRMKPPFYDLYVDKDNHKLALLRWSDLMENHPSESNLTVRTHNYYGKIDTNICNVDSPDKDDNNWVFPEKVIFLKKNRVLISWKADHKTEGLRISSQVIFIDSCKSSDFININTDIDAKQNIRVLHTILRFKDFFDIIFKYEKICPKDYCKLSFDYNGEPLSKSVLPFSNFFVEKNETLYINSLFTMENNSGIGVVLSGNKNGIFYSPTSGLLISHDVYSPILGWIKADDLYYDHHVYSNSSGFATICWVQPLRKKLYCKWLDGTHINKDGSEKTLILEIEQGINAPWISNSRDGQIIVMKPHFESENKLVFVDKVKVNGKCKRLMEITCEDWPIHVELSITEQNRYCFSFVMKHVESDNTIFKDRYPQTFNFITKCINI